MKEYIEALEQAGGDRFAESRLLPAVANKLWPRRIVNQHTALPDTDRFMQSIVRGQSGCWIWYRGTSNIGYGVFVLGGKQMAAHRASHLLFKGPIPEGMKVLHKCDVRNCVNPDHLFLGSQKDNVQDMIAKGRRHKNGASGTLNASAKLTEADVLEIRRLRSDGWLYKDIATLFGISTQNAHRIGTGQMWKHITA